MQRLAVTIFAGSLFAIAAFAETWSGTLVDVCCNHRDLSEHTR